MISSFKESGRELIKQHVIYSILRSLHIAQVWSWGKKKVIFWSLKLLTNQNRSRDNS